MRPQILPSRRRRLAGRGHLSLSNFLDPAWMMREQQQPQPQQRQQERGEDVKETEAVVTAGLLPIAWSTLRASYILDNVQ